MTRPRLLDLFSGAGGAAVGYARAGFSVTGVDLHPQPRYPYAFIRADAMDVLADAGFLAGFDAIHASPPCQHYAPVTRWRGSADDHPDLIPEVRRLLRATGLPWVIENVPGAPVRPDLVLCGSQFGLNVRRHRVFETSWAAFDLMPPCHHHDRLLPFEHKAERAYADALGCDWMTNVEAREAIPPTYTEFIGVQLLDQLALNSRRPLVPPSGLGAVHPPPSPLGNHSTQTQKGAPALQHRGAELSEVIKEEKAKVVAAVRAKAAELIAEAVKQGIGR